MEKIRPQATVLITGATGFLGAHLVLEFLRHGYKVRATYRNESSLNKARKVFSFYPETKSFLSNLEWFHLDLFCYNDVVESLKDVDYVVHAAAEVSFNVSNKNRIIENNTRITAVVTDAALACNIKKLCHISSIATLGTSANGDIITEDIRWNSIRGNSGYSISKFYAEMEVWRNIQNGLSAIIVNPSIILGPGDWHSSSTAFFSATASGLPFYTNGGSGFVDVRDVASASRIALESHIEGDRFILSSENLTFESLFLKIAQNLHKRPPFIRIHSAIAKFAAVINQVVALIKRSEPKITLESARAASKVRKYSGLKFSETFDFNYIPINETISFISRCYIKDIKH